MLTVEKENWAIRFSSDRTLFIAFLILIKRISDFMDI